MCFLSIFNCHEDFIGVCDTRFSSLIIFIWVLLSLCCFDLQGDASIVYLSKEPTFCLMGYMYCSFSLHFTNFYLNFYFFVLLVALKFGFFLFVLDLEVYSWVIYWGPCWFCNVSDPYYFPASCFWQLTTTSQSDSQFPWWILLPTFLTFSSKLLDFLIQFSDFLFNVVDFVVQCLH